MIVQRHCATSRIAVALIAAVVVTSVFPLAAHGTYDPKHGRWLQRDPIGVRVDAQIKPIAWPAARRQIKPRIEYSDGMDLYQYVRSRPTAFSDPRGLYTRSQCCGDSYDYCARRYDPFWQEQQFQACMNEETDCNGEGGAPPCRETKPKPCGPKYPPGPQAWYERDPNWCRDTPIGASKHQLGKRVTCYREMTVGTGDGNKYPEGLYGLIMGGCPPSRHVCFDEDGNCEQEHTDAVGVAQKPKYSDGTCSYSWCCTAVKKHRGDPWSP